MSNRSIKAGERRTINGLRNPSLACVPRECCGHRQSSCRADVDIAGLCLFLAHVCIERALPNVFRPGPHAADGGWSAGAKKCGQLPAHVCLHTSPCTRLPAPASFPPWPGCLVVEEGEGGWTHNNWVQGLAALPPTHSLPASETPYLSTSPHCPKGLTLYFVL